MNLAIEYLVRSEAIRNFLKLPCSLLLTSARDKDKMTVTIEEKEDGYLISHWKFESHDDGLLPQVKRHDIPKEQVFDSEKVVVPEHMLLVYHEQPISTYYNSYNRPMPKQYYDSYYHRYLNSSINLRNREYWLWTAFLEMHFPNFIEDREYVPANTSMDNVVILEQKRIQVMHIIYWNVWKMWKSLLLPSTQVAPELIFFSSFYDSCALD